MKSFPIRNSEGNPNTSILLSKGLFNCIKMTNFQILKIIVEIFFEVLLIFRGSYGYVSLVKDKATGKLYAMKVMSKKFIQ